MSSEDEVEEFAALLRRLKARTDRSYAALARPLHINASTLHRYCAGEAVPLGFAAVERFAAICGADPAERIELHRRWVLAAAARQRSRTATVSAPHAPETTGLATSGAASAPAPPATPAPAPGLPPASSPAPRTPWYGRRAALAAAAVTALAATLGGLSTLTTTAKTAGRPGHTSPTPSAPASPAHDLPPGTLTPKTTPAGGRSPAPTSSPSASTTSASAGEADPESPAPPFTWTVNSHLWATGCDHDYVIDKAPRQVPPPPLPQDAAPWARSQGAVHGGQTLVDIAVQGRTDTAVVLKALRVRVVGRAAPLKGTVYFTGQGCGADLDPRVFTVDLDLERPVPRPVQGGEGGTGTPARRMPYQVAAKAPEVLMIDARTVDCDCRWYLELDWSSQGRTGTARIDDHGTPFRTSGTKGLPQYWYANDGWTPAN
ncbi:helix-turn-helix domain-containing protein [Streptomyces sp. NPDC057438]|uniref:helix-turn-helix domain-containing protein n=1 Tax=Streptomyces sp. NPDC057438 TaxID=3346133 RepID=UPI0036B1130C